ncbi:MAG TPA: PAS domain S-box protein [Deltaproteobacteria bacterium]|nr:PAS domain S-box protein [Deltaproteobacteria bacterium]
MKRSVTDKGYLLRVMMVHCRDLICLGLVLTMTALFWIMFPAHAPAEENEPGDGPIIVGGDQALPPYEFLDSRGRPAGYNVDLIRAVAEVMGLKVEIRLGPWAEIRNALEKGEIDAVEGMFYSEKRLKYVDFSVAHTIVHNAIFIRKDYKAIESLGDLHGKEIIVQKGDIMHDYALEQGFSEKLFLVTSPGEALRLLASGRHDCALLLERQGLFLARKFRLTNITTTGPPFSPNQFCFAVRKGDYELLKDLNEGLRIIKATGRYQEIFNQWLGVLQPEVLSPVKVLKWSAIIALPLLLILAGTILWSWSLRRNVRMATDQLSRELVERKRAEQAQQRSEKKLHSIIQGSPIPTFVIDKDHMVIQWNKAMEALSGIKAEDVLNTKEHWRAFYRRERPCLSDLVLDRSPEKIVSLYGGRARESTLIPDAYEGTEFLPDIGDKGKWLNFTAAAIRDSGGNITEVVETLIDVTNNKLAEAALRESEKRYRGLFEGVPVGLYRTKPDGQILDANPAFIEMYGYPDRETILKTNAGDIYMDPDKRRQIQTLMERDGTVRGFETRVKRYDGTVRWVRINGRAVKDDDGTILFYEGSVEDITERSQALEDLQRERDRIQKYFDVAGVMLLVINRDQTIGQINRKGCEILGYSEEEIIGKNWFDHFLPAEVRQKVKFVFDKIVSGDIEPFEFFQNPVLRRDGRERLIAWHNSVLTDEHGKVVATIGSGQDITELKQAEEERRNLEARLRQSSKMEAIGTLAGGIAHDFNNILSSVLGFTEFAKIKLGKGKSIDKELDEVLKAGARARDLVKQILTFSRKSGIQKNPIELSPLIKETLKFLRASIPATIEIRQDLPPSGSTVMADPTQIHQVLMNLCTNAAHAMKETGGVLDVSLTEMELGDEIELQYKGLAKGKYLRLNIADTGCGISDEIIDRIFDPFFTTKERGEGTGMGLAVVHGIIEDLGGAITVYSEPGKGTTFHILLPKYEREKVEAPPPDAVVMKGSGRILFVDDEMGVIASGRGILEHLGYDVVSTTSAAQALEIFRSVPHEFDLVLTDMTMPGMTGIELSRELLKIRPDIAIVLCTGSNLGVTKKMISDIGIRDMVMKPMVASELAEAVYNALKAKDSEI